MATPCANLRLDKICLDVSMVHGIDSDAFSEDEVDEGIADEENWPGLVNSLRGRARNEGVDLVIEWSGPPRGIGDVKLNSSFTSVGERPSLRAAGPTLFVRRGMVTCSGTIRSARKFWIFGFIVLFLGSKLKEVLLICRLLNVTSCADTVEEEACEQRNTF